MFQQPTTIVVGAGASFDFGLPLGDKLWAGVRDVVFAVETYLQETRNGSFGYPADSLLKIVSRNSLMGEVLVRSLGDGDRDAALSMILHLAVAVRDSDVHSSVDDFLRDNPSWTTTIRALIALKLFESLYVEDNRRWRRKSLLISRVVRPGTANNPPTLNWARRFVGLCRDFLRDDPLSARMSIINFNYDRILETVLRTFWARAENTFASFDDCFEFLYPYGAFESLPEEMTSPANWILQQSAALGFAGSGTSASAAEIRNRIESSHTIFMVGFSCGSSNKKLLGLAPQQAKKIFYQNYRNGDVGLDRTLRSLGVPAANVDSGDIASLVLNGFFNQIGDEVSQPSIRRIRRTGTAQRDR